MESLPTPFLQTGQGNFPSTVTFPAFSPLIIVFILVTYTLNPFDTSASFLACSHPFRLSSVSLMSSHQHKAVFLDIMAQFLEIVPLAL